MKMGLNAYEVLANVRSYIEKADDYKAAWGCNMKFKIYDCCDDLSIFDWWNEWLSVSQLKQMEKFLQTAIDLGYGGYACFKVGAAGCSHGMWVHTLESEDGYSPSEGGCLFHSFRSGDNYYDLKLESGEWLHSRVDKDSFTLKEIKAYMD